MPMICPIYGVNGFTSGDLEGSSFTDSRCQQTRSTAVTVKMIEWRVTFEKLANNIEI
jgi:hypothetical protein